MARKSFLVAPGTGVVDDDRVVYPVSRIVDRRGIGCIDHANDVAVRDDRLVFHIDADRAAEGAVDGIATEQRGPLLQVILLAGRANDNGAQSELLAASRFLDEQSRKQASDPTEAVQNNVLRTFERRHVTADHACALALHERPRRYSLALSNLIHVLGGEFPYVDVRRPEVERLHRFKNRICLELGELVLRDLANVAIGLHETRDALVVQRSAVAVGHDVLAIQLADDRDHLFGKFFAGFPIGEIVFEAG